MLPRTILQIQRLARRPIQRVTIKQLLARSKACSEEAHIQHAAWLQEQVPVRLAHRIEGFLELPYVVLCNSRFHEVFQLFLGAFQTLFDLKEVKELDDAVEFAKTLREAYRNFAELINMMREGYGELQDVFDNIDLDAFLNQTLSTRIGNRVLAEHFLKLHDGFMNGQAGECTGVVDPKCRPAEVIETLNSSLGDVFNEVYGMRPQVVVEGELDTELSFITAHLSFILQEILKNACRATIETHMHSGGKVPPVSVEIMKGSFDVTLKVSDRGGGMRPEQLKEVWRYGCTTVVGYNSSRGGLLSSYSSPQSISSARSVAGYGFGLPLARLYAQYFGGDMVLQSMHGYGCDVYLNISHLGETLELRE